MKRERITAQEFANRFDVCVARKENGTWQYYNDIPTLNDHGWNGMFGSLPLHEITGDMPWRHSLTLPVRLQDDIGKLRYENEQLKKRIEYIEKKYIPEFEECMGQ